MSVRVTICMWKEVANCQACLRYNLRSAKHMCAVPANSMRYNAPSNTQSRHDTAGVASTHRMAHMTQVFPQMWLIHTLHAHTVTHLKKLALCDFLHFTIPLMLHDRTLLMVCFHPADPLLVQLLR